MLAIILQREFRAPAIRDVNPHLENERCSVHVGKRKVVGIDPGIIRENELAMMGLPGLKRDERLTRFTRLLAADSQTLIDGPSVAD